jgi:quercetin dioxygenase-like cupin family protein
MECCWVLGQRLDFLATGETTGGHYSLFHVFIPAGPPGPLPHRHRGADEFFFVVEGRVDVLFEDAWRPLRPGEFLHVPRGTFHTFGNATTDAARMVSGFVPSGFERFLVAEPVLLSAKAELGRPNAMTPGSPSVFTKGHQAGAIRVAAERASRLPALPEFQPLRIGGRPQQWG